MLGVARVTGRLDAVGNPAIGDLDTEEFRAAGHALIDWIADYLDHPEQHPVQPEARPGELLDGLGLEAPAEGLTQDEILEDFEKRILPRVMHWNHPGFMGYFSAGGSSAGVLGAALSAALNNVGLLWYSSPASAELEQATLRWLATLLGLPEQWFGMMHDTASTATLHAIIAAREHAAGLRAMAKSRLDLNRITIYTSKEAHSSVEKAMAALGRGVRACRKVPCDENFAMRPALLDRMISADVRAGYQPIAVVATVGTTSSTGVDPVKPIAEVAKMHRVWLHVDAAYAGVSAMLPEMRHHFEGCEQADSYVVNPHKWLFVPMDCTAFYTARPEALRRALSLVPEYLRSREDERAVNFMEYSVALGRSFRALKLWYVFRSFGTERIAATIREHVRCAAKLAHLVDEAPDFELMAPTPFSLVCFRYVPADAAEDDLGAINERLLRSVNATGEFFLSHAKLNDRYVIRVAIGNARTTEDHVRRLWDILQTKARQAD